jgi:hypothetical protein
LEQSEQLTSRAAVGAACVIIAAAMIVIAIAATRLTLSMRSPP